MNLLDYTDDHLAKLVAAMTPGQREEFDALLMSKPTRLWTPNAGAQRMVLESQAEWTFWGGEAGGGKSYGCLCIAGTEHESSVIFRRELEDFKGAFGLMEVAQRILRPWGTYHGNDRMWRLEYGGKTRFVEFQGCQRENDKYAQQGRARDLYVFDEATQFPRSIIQYITAWNRSGNPSQRARVILTGNPPMTVEGQWVLEAFAPWIDARHPRRALAGELRWYVTDDDGRDLEVDGPEDSRRFGGRVRRPQSRTFIPSVLAENPTYANGDYARKLDSLPEPLRSQLQSGDFMKAVTDDAWQVIPTAWLKAAFDRWTPKAPDVPPDVAGLDLARGGPARTVLTIRRRRWFHPQIVRPGAETPDGDSIVKLLEDSPIGVAFKRGTPINADAIGVGSSGYDSARKSKFRIRGINAGEGTDELARNRVTGFVNIRAFMYWSFREALDPEHGDKLAIHPDNDLLAELCAHRWTPRGGLIAIEKKDKVEERVGRSVDKAESMVLCYAVPVLRLVTGETTALGKPPVYDTDDSGY